MVDSADQDWLKILAGANLVSGTWQHSDPTAVQRLAEGRIARAVDDLAELAEKYCQALSEVSRGKRQVKMLPIAPRSNVLGAAPTGGGFLLLAGRCQLNLERNGNLLEATLITVDGFQRVPRRLHVFQPHVDTFGSVVWRQGNAHGVFAGNGTGNMLLMTEELIMKRLLEDLMRAALETE